MEKPLALFHYQAVALATDFVHNTQIFSYTK